MGSCVLIADDSPVIRKLLRFALNTQGYEVLVARDGMEALELLAHEDVDLVITDLNMPQLDGYEVIRSIRENKRQGDMPIIVLCSRERTTDQQKGLKLGANSCLMKPFDMSGVHGEVAKYLK